MCVFANFSGTGSLPITYQVGPGVYWIKTYTTENHIMALDRNRHVVQGFPLAVPDPTMWAGGYVVCNAVGGGCQNSK